MQQVSDVIRMVAIVMVCFIAGYASSYLKHNYNKCSEWKEIKLDDRTYTERSCKK